MKVYSHLARREIEVPARPAAIARPHDRRGPPASGDKDATIGRLLDRIDELERRLAGKGYGVAGVSPPQWRMEVHRDSLGNIREIIATPQGK